MARPLRSTFVVGVSALGLVVMSGCSSGSPATGGATRPAGGQQAESVGGSDPTTSGGSPTQTGTSSPTEAIPPYLKRITTGGHPCATLGAAGSVWVADIAGARVSRLDPATGEVTAQVKTGASPCGMAYGAGSIWVEDYGSNQVTRITLPSL